jgi:hypothetical protein
MKASDFRAGKQREKVGRLLHRHRRGQPAGWGYRVLLALLPALVAAVALAPLVATVHSPRRCAH